MKVGDEYYFYQNDHLGTPQKLTAGSGEVVWSAKYNSFGKATIEVETVENNLRFAGQFFDNETGLHYNYHRYYDPEIGRYLKSDHSHSFQGESYIIGYLTPSLLHNPSELNNFNYCISNPVKYIDRLGLKCGSGWNDKIINDKPAGCDFTSCCDSHDDCYGGSLSPCRILQKDCDNMLMWSSKNGHFS